MTIDEVGLPSTPPLYTARFFRGFAAVLVFMTGIALQFHFGQYLGFLDHKVHVHGWVMSAGVIGTLLVRLHIGRLIDFFGVRRTWFVAALIVSGAVGLFPLTTKLTAIVALQMIATVARAVVMTSVAVFAAQLAPPARRAESIGMLGLAGLLGIMIGPTLGDVIFEADTDAIGPYHWFFGISAACALVSGLIMLTDRGPAGPDVNAPPERPALGRRPRSSVIAVTIRHWPGMVMLISVVFSMVFCVQMLFLERLAEARGFGHVKTFFLIYSPTAIILRITFRRLPERIGCRATLLLGMSLFAAGLLALIPAHTAWGLLLPGLLMGAGHCFVFPSMVELAAARFPADQRGVGTSVILGAGDVGMLLGFATIGEMIRATSYATTLAALAAIAIISALAFAVTNRAGE